MYFRYGIPRALRSLRTNWRANTNNALILAASLSVLGMIVLLYLNVVHFSQNWLANTTVSLFLEPGLSDAERGRVLEQVRVHPLVRRAELVSPRQGLSELADNLGADPGLLAGAEDGGLPYTVDLEVFYEYRSRVDQLAARFRKLSGVTDVVYTERMLERVELFFRMVKGIGLFFIALIVVSFYLVISQATKLSLHARREEIEILNLVGATRGFIRSSFVVEGMLIALAGSALALAIVWFCDQLLIAGLSWNEFTRTIRTDAVFFPLRPLAAALGVAMVLGGLSARLAVNQLLRDMEP